MDKYKATTANRNRIVMINIHLIGLDIKEFHLNYCFKHFQNPNKGYFFSLKEKLQDVVTLSQTSFAQF